MDLRPLGTGGPLVGPLGLGTVKFGRNTGVKYPQGFDLPSDDQIDRLLAAAHDLGVNLLDTAPAYGLAEQRLGAALQRVGGDWVVATKVGETFDGRNSSFDFSAAAITASVDRSLARLKRDCLDLVLVHSDGRDLEIIEQDRVFETLGELRRAGKLRRFGLSGKTVAGGLRAVADSDAVMVTHNPEYDAERPVIAAAAAAGKAVLIKKALASGHLGLEGDPVQAAMDCAFAEPGVTSVIVGTLSPEHLAADVAAATRALAGPA